MDKSILFKLLAGETVANAGGQSVNRAQFFEYSKRVTMDYENVAFFDSILDYAYRWEYWMSKLAENDSDEAPMYPSVLVVEEQSMKKITKSANNSSSTAALDSSLQLLPTQKITSSSILSLASSNPMLVAENKKVAGLKAAAVSSGIGMVRSSSSLQKIVSILMFVDKPDAEPLKKTKSFNDCVQLLERQQNQQILASCVEKENNDNVSNSVPTLSKYSPPNMSLPEIMRSGSAMSAFMQKEFRVLRRLDLENEKKKERGAFGIPQEHLKSKSEFDKFCKKRCRDMFSKFFTADNPFELNISGATKRLLTDAIDARDLRPIIFKKALDEVIVNISTNSFSRFIKQKTLNLGDNNSTKSQLEYASFY